MCQRYTCKEKKEALKLVIELQTKGVSFNSACTSTGISPQSIYKWLRQLDEGTLCKEEKKYPIVDDIKDVLNNKKALAELYKGE